MATGQERFIAQLEKAVNRVEIMPEGEVAMLLRRAVWRLQGMHASMTESGFTESGEHGDDPDNVDM